MLSFEPLSTANFVKLFAMSSASTYYLITFWIFGIYTKSQRPSVPTIKYLCVNLNYIFLISGTAVKPDFFREKSPKALVTAKTPQSLLLRIAPPFYLH